MDAQIVGERLLAQPVSRPVSVYGHEKGADQLSPPWKLATDMLQRPLESALSKLPQVGPEKVITPMAECHWLTSIIHPSSG
jgi:hypothetical protein